MTKEELEKEAEEYQIRKHHQRLYGHKPVVMKELNTTYKDGYKDGYNKAKGEVITETTKNYNAIIADYEKHYKERIAELEKANEWHYMKDGLSEKKKYVLIYTDLKNVYIARLVEDDYFITNKGGFVQTSSVIAWKEIALPKESE